MGAHEELKALGSVVDRLQEKFASVPRLTIEDIVHQEHRRLDAGRVRDFVPILVEHAARDRLARSRTPKRSAREELLPEDQSAPSAESEADGALTQF